MTDQSIATTISVASIIILFLIGLAYKIYQDFIYKSIKNTIDLTKLAGEMRVGRFGMFIWLWIILIFSNGFIHEIIFEKKDYLNQAKNTSILYLGIVGITFILIGLVPSLVEIFENTFGLLIVSQWPISLLFQHKEIMEVFESRAFPNSKDIVIPFDSLLPLFNIHTFEDTFEAIATQSDEKEGEQYDFKFNYDKMCTSNDNEDSKQHFKNALFKLCFAKYNAGHFAWVYIASIVTILSTIAVK